MYMSCCFFFASRIAIILFLYLYMYFYRLAVNKSCSNLIVWETRLRQWYSGKN